MSALSSSKFSSPGSNMTLQTDSHTAGCTATERPEMFLAQNAEFFGIFMFYSPFSLSNSHSPASDFFQTRAIINSTVIWE